MFPSALDQALQGNINYPSDSIKCALLSSVPSLSGSAVHWSDVSANEITGTGYTAGGQALTSKTHTITEASAWGTTWAATTAHAVGDVVVPTSSNGFMYVCVTAGTTGSSAPTWPTVVGQTVTDGSVTWSCLAESICVYSSAAPSWTSSTITAVCAVIYDAQSGTASTEPLISLVNFGGSQSDSAGTFTVTPPSLGWFVTCPA
jgi:hypothetical protein